MDSEGEDFEPPAGTGAEGEESEGDSQEESDGEGEDGENEEAGADNSALKSPAGKY